MMVLSDRKYDCVAYEYYKWVYFTNMVYPIFEHVHVIAFDNFL